MTYSWPWWRILVGNIQRHPNRFEVARVLEDGGANGGRTSTACYRTLLTGCYLRARLDVRKANSRADRVALLDVPGPRNSREWSFSKNNLTSSKWIPSNPLSDTRDISMLTARSSHPNTGGTISLVKDCDSRGDR